ncbi:putative metal-dependent hydrolase [Chitinophaga horti]|uniref:Metal-dependent hydrolase n=1 Tax=Chitinophaga horti TaxID=2920382 RepID=A0ABY6J4Z6_9BACT|nr:putative metal-dependent hydrolase [Chitinophaga horti]UYQ94746.1 putative metal-dependent hydrolase [Chitinophaga horti]
MDLETLKYPIGRFVTPQSASAQQRTRLINDIRQLPTLVEIAVQNLDEHQLQTPYRPDGWTIAQVVHHLVDSHMNALTRFKLALTEYNPVIKPYDEAAWAALPDVSNTPVNVSITLLHALHTRWSNLLEALTDEQYERTFVHPESKQTFKLWQTLASYSWHGLHHLTHIVNLKESKGW